jgi:hypothetical protein
VAPAYAHRIKGRVGTKGRKRILAIMLEFSDWRDAKPWSYLASYALLDGFDACEIDWTMLPSVVVHGDNSANPWIDAREGLLAGEQFDQAWVWLTHANYPTDFWSWLEQIAPVRVGVLMESLRYTPDEIAVQPSFAMRFDAVVRQARRLTHILSYDEHDVAELAKVTGRPTRLYHSMIPASMVRQETAPADGKILFLGTLYEKRLTYLAREGLGDRLTVMKPPEAGSDLETAFDALHREALDTLAQGRMTRAEMYDFALRLRTIRRGVVQGVLDAYRGGIAVVNLPAYFKGFPGRIVEAVAAGVPMVTNRLESRPETEATFVDGRDILYYDPYRPGDLARQLDALLADEAKRQSLVAHGRKRLLECLTSEAQMPGILSWIESQWLTTGLHAIRSAITKAVGIDPRTPDEVVQEAFAKEPNPAFSPDGPVTPLAARGNLRAQALTLDHAILRPARGGNIVPMEDGLAVLPSPEAWSYGLVVPLDPMTLAGVDWLVVETGPVAEAFGLSLLNGAGSDFQCRLKTPTRKRSLQAWLPVQHPADTSALVLSNWARPLNAEVIVRRIYLVSEKDPGVLAIDPLGPETSLANRSDVTARSIPITEDGGRLLVRPPSQAWSYGLEIPLRAFLVKGDQAVVVDVVGAEAPFGIGLLDQEGNFCVRVKTPARTQRLEVWLPFPLDAAVNTLVLHNWEIPLRRPVELLGVRLVSASTRPGP